MSTPKAPKSPHRPAPSEAQLAKIHEAEVDAESPHGELADRHRQPYVNHLDAPDSHDPPATGDNGISANFAAVNRDLEAAAKARLHGPPKSDSDRSEKEPAPKPVPQKKVVPQNAVQGKKAAAAKKTVTSKVEDTEESAVDGKNTPAAKRNADDSDVEVPKEANPTVVQRETAGAKVTGPVGEVGVDVGQDGTK